MNTEDLLPLLDLLVKKRQRIRSLAAFLRVLRGAERQHASHRDDGPCDVHHAFASSVDETCDAAMELWCRSAKSCVSAARFAGNGPKCAGHYDREPARRNVPDPHRLEITGGGRMGRGCSAVVRASCCGEFSTAAAGETEPSDQFSTNIAACARNSRCSRRGTARVRRYTRADDVGLFSPRDPAPRGSR